MASGNQQLKNEGWERFDRLTDASWPIAYLRELVKIMIMEIQQVSVPIGQSGRHASPRSPAHNVQLESHFRGWLCF